GVDNISFEVKTGKILGFLGPNGAGKTTTISMIAGVITPSRGTATIAGHDIRTDSFAARRVLGLVPQDLAVYEELTARQNLRFFASLYDVPRAELTARIDWALELAGLQDRADRAVRTYSGGMKRRLNLVTGLVHRPKLVILDEPTVGVDPQSRNFLFEAIEALANEGMTIVYTSHYMEEVETLCRRVAVVDHGKLIALDDVADLVAEHARGTVTIEFAGEQSAVDTAFGEREQVTVAEGSLLFHGDVVLSELIAELEGLSVAVTRVASAEANLETVFLELTGHSLRDDE
ncbi:MAG: ABC transporter ATP-binding protein, partial [Deltaproteobacteria bacterium]|nr:ABC transporter ATP-binding protein [Deltaproteobacteria bacterium]